MGGAEDLPPYRRGVVEEVLGGHSVEGLRVRDVGTGKGRVLDVDGLFVAIGYEPHLGPFAGLLETDGGGYVILKESTMTNEPGVFAAGRYLQQIERGQYAY